MPLRRTPHGAVSAGAGRSLGADQGQLTGGPLPPWRITASTDGDACVTFFSTAAGWPNRAGNLTSSRRSAWPRSADAVSELASRAPMPWHGGATSRPWRNAGSALRQIEKRPGGAPIGGGAAFVPSVAHDLVIQTILYRPADHPSRSRPVSHRRRVVFPRVDRGAVTWLHRHARGKRRVPR